MAGEDLYLPTAPNKLVRGIRVDSGIPLQSAAKVPIMITFNVVDRDGDQNNVMPQACIFKVSLCTCYYVYIIMGLSKICLLSYVTFFSCEYLQMKDHLVTHAG